MTLIGISVLQACIFPMCIIRNRKETKINYLVVVYCKRPELRCLLPESHCLYVNDCAALAKLVASFLLSVENNIVGLNVI